MSEHDARNWINSWFKSRNVKIHSCHELSINGKIFILNLAVAEINCDFIANKPEKSRITLQVLRNAIDLKIEQEIKMKHKEMIQKLKYKPDANNNLEKFVFALIGRHDKIVFNVMKHFIWQVKRKMFGLKVYDHLMPILYGGTQRQGKSEAIKKLLSPIDGLWIAGKFNDLIDERHAKFFEQNFAMFFDEMRGAKKTDVEATKERITAEYIAYRILFTHDFNMIKNNCTLIGTSNLPLSLMIKDVSGMRRFYEIEIKQRCDWELINSIDYEALWLGVDEQQETPAIESVRTQIEGQQEENRDKCSVEQWIEEYELTLGNVKNILNDAYSHYSHFCRNSGLFTDSKRLFGIKLKSLLKADSQPIHGFRYYLFNKFLSAVLGL